jgi:putative transposase
MTRPEKILIQRHLSCEELNKRIKTLERNTKILQRLYFIKYRYEGKSVAESAHLVGITRNEGYIWQRRWNEDGYAGLVPRYGGGRPSKLLYKQREELIDLLKQKDTWTTNEVKDLIRKEFDVEYSLKQVRIILKKVGMNYAKPYSHDYRRPPDAEERLKKLTRNR